jgi:hypothetical protein
LIIKTPNSEINLKTPYPASLLLLTAAFAVISPAAVLTENFDDVTTLAGNGWVIANQSVGVGTTDWFQGNSGIFGSQAGAGDSYIAANFNSADFGGHISNWLLSPVLSFNNGDTISFFSRVTDNPAAFPDRLELRFSTNGASTATGDFALLLLTINPALTSTGYPGAWSQFSATLSGLGGPTSGRFAFHYDVPDTSLEADYIGIDTLSVTANASVPEPSTWAMASLGLGALTYFRRRR